MSYNINNNIANLNAKVFMLEIFKLLVRNDRYASDVTELLVVYHLPTTEQVRNSTNL